MVLDTISEEPENYVEAPMQEALPVQEAPVEDIPAPDQIGPFSYFDLMGTADAIKQSQTLEAPTFNKAFMAGIEKDSFVYNNALTGLETVRRTLMGDFDPSFDVFQPKYLSQVDPGDYSDISLSTSENDFYRRVARINQQKAARDTAHLGSGWAALAAGVADGITNPFYMIPIAKGFRYAAGAKSFGSGAARAIPSLAGGAAASESLLYSQQSTRTLPEVGINIAANTVLGAILGGTGNLLRTTNAKIYKDMFSSVAEGMDVKFRLSEKGEIEGLTIIDDSVGAMSTREISLEGEGLHGFDGEGVISASAPLFWLTGKLARNPVVLGLTSKSAAVRKFTNDAYDHNFVLAKNILHGEYAQVSLQNKIDTGITDMMRMQFDVERSYYEYLGIDASKEASIILQDVKSKLANKEGRLTNSEYKSALYYAVVTGEQHADPHINSKAKHLNDTYNKPIDEELGTLGYIGLGESPYGAVNHLSRMYDNRGIMADRTNKRAWLTEKYNQTNNDIVEFTRNLRDLKESKAPKERIETEELRLQKEIDSGKFDKKYLIEEGGKLRFRKILESRAEIEAAADDTIDTILGMSEEQLYSRMVEAMGANGANRNMLKDRVLMISDAELIKAGFLLTDINKALSAKIIRARRLIELDKYFKSRGWDGKSNQLDFLANDIRNDYRSMEAAIENKYENKIENASGDEKKKLEVKRGKSIIRLNKQLDRDVTNVASTYKRISGSYDRNQRAMIRTFRVLKQWAYSTQLGAALLPALQDAFSPIFRSGLKSYVEGGVLPFLLNTLKMSNGNARFRQDARDLALGIETVIAYFGQRMPQSLDYTLPMDFLESSTDIAARAMSIFNMSSIFTDTFQAVAATATQSRLIRDLRAWKGGTLTRAAQEQLQVLRLNPDELIKVGDKNVKLGESILQQYEQHGEELSGGYLMNWHDWDHVETKRLFQSFVKKEVKSVIFSGNNIASFPQGVNPNDIGSAFLTYMGYSFNATANFLLPFAQRPDFNKLQGLGAMTAMGMLIDPLRKIADGKDPELEPGVLIKKGVLNAGWGGILVDGFNRINATWDFVPSLQVDKFRDKNAGELLLGAPGSLAVDALKVAASTINGEFNEKDTKMAKGMTPLLNVIYLRQPFNAAIESLNLPKNRAQARTANELEQ